MIRATNLKKRPVSSTTLYYNWAFGLGSGMTGAKFARLGQTVEPRFAFLFHARLRPGSKSCEIIGTEYEYNERVGNLTLQIMCARCSLPGVHDVG